MKQRNATSTSGTIQDDPFVPSEGFGRREFCSKTAIGLTAAFVSAFPWAKEALAAIASPYQKFPPPQIRFTKNSTGDGMIGPFGTARIYKFNGVSLPMIISTRDGSGTMDLTGRIPVIRIGANSETAIFLNAQGWRTGARGRLQPWNPASVKGLIEIVSNDRDKASAIILLRSTLYTSYPVAIEAYRAKMGNKMANTLSQHSSKLGATSMRCTTTTVTDTVTKVVSETVEVIQTAQQQYQECYDREAVKDPCKSMGVFAGTCAAAACSLKTFEDMIVGFTTVLVTITEEVVREVVTCEKALVKTWPNPWDITPKTFTTGVVAQPAVKFGAAEVNEAIKFLKQLTGVFGPFGKCFLEGKWGLAQLQTPLDLGNGKIVIPYGIKVCITAECARQLSIGNIGGELLSTWSVALGALAAVSAEAAAVLLPLGVTATGWIAALAASVPPVVVTIAAVIMAFIIVILIHATVISAQLGFQVCCTNNLADNSVCIEHPTFALAMLTMLQGGMGGPTVLLVPPTVTG